MCGFVGCIDINISYGKLKKATKTIIHRGPDATTITKGKNWIVGFNRLAIIDLNKRSNQSIKSKTNTYILCKVNGVERTLYFNEYNKLFVESSGINEIELSDVEFSTTHILGSNGTEEILINRVSGSIIITQSNTKPSEGMCELFDNKKF